MLKYAELASNQRTMLSMLCTGQSFKTDELAKACCPSIGAGDAAHVLCNMRDAGLVFSNQKPSSQRYADWKVSEYGKLVFMGRSAQAVPAPSLSERILELLKASGAPLSSVGIGALLAANSAEVLQALMGMSASVQRLPGKGWVLRNCNSTTIPQITGVPATAQNKPYRILRVCDTGITLFDKKCDTAEEAAAFARANIEKASPDTVNYVVTLHKSMRFIPPVAAGVEVEEY